MKLNWVRLTMTVLIGSAFLAGPVAAENLNVPSMTATHSKPGSVRLIVEAGDSGAPAGFFVERMTKAEYDALGAWPESPTSSWVGHDYTGVPTFNMQGTAGSYVLGADQTIEIELGQMFDETGVIANDVEELDPATEYVIRIRANAAGASDASVFSETMVVSSAPLAQNCTYTIGYWKNHTGVWPVTNLTLGSVNYTAAELLAILNQPAQGNKLVILAHQLIAAKLNIANGADPSAAAATISASDALIGSLVPPPIGSDDLPSSPATGYANTLDDYNNGIIGPGHCGTVPATASTWGKIKSQYRN
jgi:hypothetical protein